MDHGGKMPVPRSADEWLSREGELLPTESISVKPDGKYFAVEGTKAAQTVACP
jgi:DNA repair protein RadD